MVQDPEDPKTRMTEQLQDDALQAQRDAGARVIRRFLSACGLAATVASFFISNHDVGRGVLGAGLFLSFLGSLL